MANKSFVMYDSWTEMVEELTDEEAGRLLKAIYAYRQDKTHKPEDRALRPVFNILKQRFDEDEEAYQDKIAKRSEAGQKGGRPKAEESNEKQTKAKKANAFFDKQKNPESESESESDTDTDKDQKKKHRPAFVPPTVEEVRVYCQERKNKVDPEQFVSYYESQKWRKANGIQVADWKACVRTWEKRETARSGTRPARSPSFSDQRSYDYVELESRLIGGGAS